MSLSLCVDSPVKSVTVETIDLTESDDGDDGGGDGNVDDDDDESCSTSTDDYTINCYSPSVSSSKLLFTSLCTRVNGSLCSCYGHLLVPGRPRKNGIDNICDCQDLTGSGLTQKIGVKLWPDLSDNT